MTWRTLTISPGLRRILALALVPLFGAAVPALAQTAADRGVPDGLSRTSRSANFLVHYTTTGPNRTTIPPRFFLRWAEHGLDRLVRVHGLRRPRRDRDGLIDIYVHNRIGPGAVAQAGADDDRGGVPSSGYLEVDSDERDRGTLVHELMHVIQYAYGMGTESGWFLEGSAAWASTAVFGAGTTDAAFFTPISASLLCEPARRCPGDGPYGAWRFWESLNETFGPTFVAQVYARDSALVRRAGGGDPSLPALARTLQARGSSLPRALQEYVERSARADWTHPALGPIESITSRDAGTGEEVYRQLVAGAARVRVPLSPLSGRYVRITEPRDETSCGPRTMTVTVRVPAGSLTVPSLLLRVVDAETSVPMTAADGTFQASVDWEACRSDAYVLLSNPNGTRTASIEVAAQTAARSVDTIAPASARARG